MRIQRIIGLTLAVSGLLCVAGLSGCATPEKTEGLLTKAGFRTRAPTTPQQQEIYEHLEPYKLKRTVIGRTAVYCYKDEKQGVLYVGDEKNYQEYQHLGYQEAVSPEDLEAQPVSRDLNMQLSGWGPGMWWRDGQ